MSSKKSSPSLGKKAVLGTLYTFIGDYLVYLINFVRGIVLARLLMPEMFGIVTLAEFFRGLFGQPTNIGFDQAVIQRKDRLEEAYNGHFLLINGAALLSIVLAVIAAPFLAAQYGKKTVQVMLVLMLLLLVQTLAATPGTYLRKNFFFKRLSVIQVIGSVVAFIVSVYLALNGYGVWALVSVSVVTGIIGLVLAWILSPWRPTARFNKKVNREVLRFGSTIWVGGLFSFVMLQFDDFLVGRFAGLAALGFYSKAYALAQQPLGLFSQVINKVAGPAIATLQDEQEKLEKGINLILSFVYKGTVFLGGVLFIWAREIITLLIGEKWLPMVPMFRGLILYLVAQPVWDIMRSYFTFTGRPKKFVKGQAIQALMLVLLGTGVVFKWGGIGAALVVSAILLTTTLFYLWCYVGKEIRIRWKDNFVIPTLGVLIAMSVSRWVIQAWFRQGVAFWVGVAILPLALYLLSLLVMQGSRLIADLHYLYRLVKREGN